MPVYGEEDIPAAGYPAENRYAPRDARLEDELYPEEDTGEYDEEEEGGRRRGLIIALISLVAVLALFALGMVLLPRFADRPRDGGGFVCALYDLRDKMGSALGVKQTPAEIHLFQTASTAVQVGTQMQFNITTTKAVQDVGITDAEGKLLPSSRQCKDAENTTWLVNNAEGIPMLGVSFTELLPHGLHPDYGMDIAWNFMKHYSRNVETGELVYNPYAK